MQECEGSKTSGQGDDLDKKTEQGRVDEQEYGRNRAGCTDSAMALWPSGVESNDHDDDGY